MRSVLFVIGVLAAVSLCSYAGTQDDLRRRAEAGEAKAQVDLGTMYLAGAGVPKDSAEAAKWYRKAAEQGFAPAQCTLGTMYANGEGVPKALAEAAKWFRRAAEQGNAEAQYNLGNQYAKGDGVRKDLVEARVWWNIAGAKGNEGAKKNLASIGKDMTSEQKAEAMKRAREMWEKIKAKE